MSSSACISLVVLFPFGRSRLPPYEIKSPLKICMNILKHRHQAGMSLPVSTTPPISPLAPVSCASPLSPWLVLHHRLVRSPCRLRRRLSTVAADVSLTTDATASLDGRRTARAASPRRRAPSQSRADATDAWAADAGRHAAPAESGRIRRLIGALLCLNRDTDRR